MDRKRGNWIFFWIYLLFWLGDNCLSPYLGVFYESKGLTGTQIGVVNSAFSIAIILAALVIGGAGDRLGRPKKLLLLLCGGMMAGVGLLYLGGSYSQILLAVVLYGAAYSPVNGIVDKVLMSRLKEVPSQFGRYRMGGTVGAGIGVLIAGLLVGSASFFPIFSVYWLAMAACAFFTLALPPEPSGCSVQRASLGDYKIILRHRRFLPIYLTMAVWGFTESSVTQFQALHIAASGLAREYTSLFVAAAMAGEALMFAAVPRLSVRLGTERTVAMAFALQFCRVGALAFLRWIPLPLAVFCQFIGGGAYASLYSMVTQEISQTFPERVGCSAQTLKLVVNRGVGVTCGSLLLGYWYQQGASVVSYAILAAAAGAFALAAWGLGRRGVRLKSEQTEGIPRG